VDWSADHTAFEDPSAGMTFTAVWVAGVAVMLADDLERPMKLRIRLDRLPRRRLYIDWDGARWGWRGDAVGAS
jgi:hypothetical protein